MSIIARLEPFLSRKLCSDFESKFGTTDYPSALEDNYGCVNGYSEGDYIQLRPEIDLKGGRLKQQRDYYRFSAPIFKYAGRKQEEGIKVGSNCAIVFPDGGVNYVENPMTVFALFPVFEVRLSDALGFETTAEKEMVLGFVAWLKSSFLLWYMSSIQQTDDVFDLMLNKRRIPITADNGFLRSLSVFAQNIIIAEQAHLKMTSKNSPSKSERERISDQILKHNKAVRHNMRLIDREIFRHFQFTAEEITEVYRVLRSLDLFDYDINATLETFVKEVTGKE